MMSSICFASEAFTDGLFPERFTTTMGDIWQIACCNEEMEHDPDEEQILGFWADDPAKIVA